MSSKAPFRNEILELTELNRRSSDTEIERRLIELRHRALSELEPVDQPATWPPRIPDLFPGEKRVPEVPSSEVTGDVLRSAVFHHGALLVRGLLDTASAEGLVAEIDLVLKDRQSYKDGKEAGVDDSSFVPFDAPGDPASRDAQEFTRDLAYGRALLDAQGCVLAIDAPRVFFKLIELFDHGRIGELASSFFGEQPTILGKKWTLRRASPDLGDEGHHPDIPVSNPGWHQDGAFMGDVRSLNVWIALSECGEDAPSMDIVARRLDGIVETGTQGAPFAWAVGNAIAEHIADGAIVRPRLSPGDALLFDHLLLHRTDNRQGMTRPRYAIEAWFAAGSNYPPDQIPMIY